MLRNMQVIIFIKGALKCDEMPCDLKKRVVTILLLVLFQHLYQLL
jgi:hypothetical protein